MNLYSLLRNALLRVVQFGEYSVRVRIPTDLTNVSAGAPAAAVVTPVKAATPAEPAASTGLGAIFERSASLRPVETGVVETMPDADAEDMVTIPVRVLKYVPKDANDELLLAKPKTEKKKK